jgi:hypothetical protein
VGVGNVMILCEGERWTILAPTIIWKKEEIGGRIKSRYPLASKSPNNVVYNGFFFFGPFLLRQGGYCV